MVIHRIVPTGITVKPRVLEFQSRVTLEIVALGICLLPRGIKQLAGSLSWEGPEQSLTADVRDCPAPPDFQLSFPEGLCPCQLQHRCSSVALSLSLCQMFVMSPLSPFHALPAAHPNSGREQGTAAGSGLGLRGLWAPVQPRYGRGIWILQAPASFWFSESEERLACFIKN